VITGDDILIEYVCRVVT